MKTTRDKMVHVKKYQRIETRYIVDEDGNKTHVVLDMKSYESMIGRMEKWAELQKACTQKADRILDLKEFENSVEKQLKKNEDDQIRVGKAFAQAILNRYKEKPRQIKDKSE